MDNIIFHSIEELKAFYNANCDDTRKHWYYGPIETQGTKDDVWTLKEAYDDIMSMDDETIFGTEGYFEIWDVDDNGIEYVAVYKDGKLYAPEKVDWNSERAKSEKYEDLGFKRADEGDFVYDIVGGDIKDGKGYFAFVSKATLEWLEEHYGVTRGSVPEEDTEAEEAEEDYPF